MLNRRSVLIAILSTFLMAVSVGPQVRADDKKVDANGKWKWTVTRNNQTRDILLTLKQDGEKVTGTINQNNTDTEITEGKIKEAEISFKVVRKGQNGQERTTTYTGKIDGDVIKGKIESTGTQNRSRDWEAKRSKD